MRRALRGPASGVANGLIARPPAERGHRLAGPHDRAGNKLAWTLQNYGAYVVDDTSWNVDAFDAEIGVADEFRGVFGMGMAAGAGPWYEDAMPLFGALAVVDNNAPEASEAAARHCNRSPRPSETGTLTAGGALLDMAYA